MKIDPSEQPAYSMREAAWYLALPASTVREWVRGRGDQPSLITPAQSAPVLLSFVNVAEIFVLASLRRYGMTMRAIRRAVEKLKELPHHGHPLIEQDLLLHNVELLVETGDQLINLTRGKQLGVKAFLEASLRRVIRDASGKIVQIQPWLCDIGEEVTVYIDPRRSFGRLVLGGTGIPVEEIVGRFNAGDSIDDIAADFRLKGGQVEAAIRWDSRGRTA